MPIDCDITLHSIPVEPSLVKAEMAGKASSVLSNAQSLANTAQSLSSQAAGMISGAAGFSAGSGPSISFNASVNASYSFMEGPSVTANAPSFSVSSASLGSPPSLSIRGFNPSSIDIPSLTTIAFNQSMMSFPSVGAPTAPGSRSVEVSASPGFSINADMSGVPDVGPPPDAPAISTDEIPLLDIEPYEIRDLSMPTTEDFDRLEAMLSRDFQVPEYHQKLLPTLMPAVGALVAQGGFTVSVDELFEVSDTLLHRAHDEYGQRLGSLWTRRGMLNPQDRQLEARTGNVRGRYLEYTRAEYDAAVARWRMKLLPVAMELATEAHGMVMEILGSLYDLEFEYLAARQVAFLSLYGLAVARFNLKVAQLQIAAAQYRGRVAHIQGRASRFGILVKQQNYFANLNTALSSAYQAKHRVVMLQGDVYKTEASLVEADLRAYKAWVQSIEAQARAVRASFVEYEARAAAWSAEAESVANRHRINQLEHRKTAARNRAIAAQVSADATQAAAVGYEASRIAAEVRSAVATARGQIANSMSQSDQTSFNNMMATAQSTIANDQYRINATAAGLEALSGRATLGAIREANSRSASLYDQVAQGAIKAAELSQQYRIKLADAYQNVYNAVGKADAARVAGELSRYRGSVGLQAQGQISHSSQLTRQVRSSSDFQSSDSNECVSNWAYYEKAQT